MRSNESGCGELVGTNKIKTNLKSFIYICVYTTEEIEGLQKKETYKEICQDETQEAIVHFVAHGLCG